MMKPGRQFEEAVYSFVKALDPSAKVFFNHRVPDRDTGTPRQCDAWIAGKFGGHWAISILVSCKDRRKSGRKLHIGDIDAFCREVRSTRASMGVLYCNVGFSKPAVEKAKANRINCCRLYQNEPADIPEAIWLERFVCKASVALVLETDVRNATFKTWNDLFVIEKEVGSERETILDILCEAFARAEAKAVAESRGKAPFPPNWRSDLAFAIEGMDHEVRVQVWVLWKRYRARFQATLLEGSYCVSDGGFKGRQIGPSIDLKSVHPGGGWEEITGRDFVPPPRGVVAVLHGGDVRKALREGYGPRPLYQEGVREGQ